MVQIISSFSFLGVREFQKTHVCSKTCSNVEMNDDQTNLQYKLNIYYHYLANAHGRSSKKKIQFEVKIIEYFSE